MQQMAWDFGEMGSVFEFVSDFPCDFSEYTYIFSASFSSVK